ncbi:MAG: hypothetical protein H6917_09575 [Novosphingobium sp.]|nr:hypothetical protein [Novosphingobium sp.]MCP5402619.1 hypothetical protein [Novosphingobium sp.]
MTGTATFVAIITALGALVLAMRGLQSHRLPTEKKVRMAVMWILIIAGTAFLFSRLGY